jgi:hypothetical protein
VRNVGARERRVDTKLSILKLKRATNVSPQLSLPRETEPEKTTNNNNNNNLNLFDARGRQVPKELIRPCASIVRIARRNTDRLAIHNAARVQTFGQREFNRRISTIDQRTKRRS